MIKLTRLGHGETFFLNPDLIERIDSHVDTVIRLTNGVEYVVAETGDQIVALIVTYRGQIMAHGPTVARAIADSDANDTTESGDRDSGDRGATVVELPTHREADR